MGHGKECLARNSCTFQRRKLRHFAGAWSCARTGLLHARRANAIFVPGHVVIENLAALRSDGRFRGLEWKIFEQQGQEQKRATVHQERKAELPFGRFGPKQRHIVENGGGDQREVRRIAGEDGAQPRPPRCAEERAWRQKLRRTDRGRGRIPGAKRRSSARRRRFRCGLREQVAGLKLLIRGCFAALEYHDAFPRCNMWQQTGVAHGSVSTPKLRTTRWQPTGPKAAGIHPEPEIKMCTKTSKRSMGEPR